MRLRPLGDRILVKPLERVRSDVLVVVGEETPQFGVVERVGPGKHGKRGIEPLEVQPGDLIRFGADYMKFPEYEGFLILQEADVAGVVE